MAKKIPLELQVEKEKTNQEVIREVISSGRQIAVVLANSHIFQMIAGLVTVELLQKVTIKEQPLISDTLANGMTAAIFAAEATSAVSDIVSLLNPFD
jgi:CheY-like chemotaxis protein